ncbi:MAG: VWA domain-containing protein [Alphaproteobacteria bacterium]|nr:VWA domain-containing protein [Alphaproteobacteria bacterium]
MSCGLGAIILVLMLVRHDVQNVSVESERLTAELDRLQQSEELLSAEVVGALRARLATMGEIEALESELARARAEIARARAQIAASETRREDLQETIETAETVDNTDVVEDRQVGEENYLIGMQVKGPRIAILVDSSASMTDEALIDIIRRKNMADASKVTGPKWQRTLRVARWLLARVPRDSDVRMISFAEKATSLGDAGGSDAAALGRILGGLNQVVPEGPTNLAAALEAAAAFRPTDIYLVTDGLPTAGNSGYRSLNPFSGCSALWGGSTSISGECRNRLFTHTVNNAPVKNAEVNVVLLPIEGDPDAAHLYWRWTAATDGLLISPAESWP